MKPDQDQIEDQLLDALLHQQNRGDREQTIADIEAAVDGVKYSDDEIIRPKWPRRLGTIAALIALGCVVVLWTMDSSSNDEPEMAFPRTPAALETESAATEIAIRELEDQVEERRKILLTINQQKDRAEISDRPDGLDGEKIQLETQIEGLLKYDGDQLLIYASGLDLPDNIIKDLYPQYLELKRQTDALRASGMGERHPNLQSHQRVLDSFKRDLDEGVVNLRTRLLGRLEIANERFAKIRLKEKESNIRPLERNLDTQDYVDAKRDYDDKKAQLMRLRLKQAGDLGLNANQSLAANEPRALEKPTGPVSRTKAISTIPPSDQIPLTEIAENSAPADFGRNESSGRSLRDWGGREEPAIPRVRRVPPPGEQANSERYSPLIDPTWERPTENPLSTFSIDVDTASYANIRRMIREGRDIPADAVRIEECVNAFKYDYEPPAGDQAFAVHTELATCPWNEDHLLVKFGIKGREIASEKRPVSNLVFLIDVSGSMQSGNKLPLVRESLKLLLHQLDERDSVSYVVYAGREGVVLPPTKMTESSRVKALEALDQLEAGGSTNGGAGIKRAYELAMENFIDGGVNRVILASDGDFNVGVTGNDALVKLVKERAAENIYLSALAFGTGNLNDAMFEAISNEGNGNYFYIDSIREGRKVFLENLTGSLITIAKDVKIQVEFNPGKIGSYRLIGYANRVLEDEDFNNDKVDAGDIGAGHTVTAFYEIVPAGVPQPNGGGVDELKYQKPGLDVKAPAGPDDEWLTLKLRHKHPQGDISALQETVVKGRATPWQQAGSDFQFASAVAIFGMKLRGMDDVSEIPWESVRQLARPGLLDDGNEDRAEFVELIGTLEQRSR